jgi:hypothetical protein
VTITLVHVCSTLLVTCCLIVLGQQLKHRLQSSSPNRSERIRNEIHLKTMVILRRTNLVLVICAVCYGIRTLFLLILTLESLTGETASGQKVLGMPSIVWFILTSWVPTLFPVLRSLLSILLPLLGSHLPLHHALPTAPAPQERGPEPVAARRRGSQLLELVRKEHQRRPPEPSCEQRLDTEPVQVRQVPRPGPGGEKAFPVSDRLSSPERHQDTLLEHHSPQLPQRDQQLNSSHQVWKVPVCCTSVCRREP